MNRITNFNFIQLFVTFLSFWTSNCENTAMAAYSRNKDLIPSDAILRILNPLQVKISEDGQLNFTGLSKKYIRPAEEYEVITEDGYILKLFHIPGNVCRVVLFCHGILVTSDCFMLRGNTSLFYMMAEQGFDIWAMNIRGNRYSRKHVRLNPDRDYKYWQYSMHEVGIYDYKAVIDFILKKTRQEQLSVVADSEGTSAFFILMSQRPEYNKKVKIFAGLAPVCYLNHSGPVLKIILQLSSILKKLLVLIFGQEFVGYNSLSKKLIDIICSQGTASYMFCFSILGAVTGFNSENIEEEFSYTILGHFPAGTSIKNLNHYANVYHRNDFVEYDYGLRNLAVYRSLKPPAYDLSKVTIKVAMFAAQGDKLLGIPDVERLRKTLKNVVHYQMVSDKKFNHIDFMWGKNAHTVLYSYVIDILLKYN